jgi:hypothetical protein
MFQWSRRYLMNEGDQAEFGAWRETGEIYMLSKKERILTIEVLKLTLAAPARRQLLVERFGKEGLEIAASLLGQMGVKVGKTQGQKPGTNS